MATTTYSTILPDSADDEYGVHRLYRQPQHQIHPAREPPQPMMQKSMVKNEEPPRGPDGDPMIKKIIDNKTLTHGLIVVIAILLILLIVQIVRSRNLVDPAMQQAHESPPRNYPPPGQQQQQQMMHSTQPNQKIDDAMYAHYMKKSTPTRAPGARKGGAMAAFANARKASDDSERLATIAEESTPEPDSEQENMRSAITELLKKDDPNELALAAGSQVVENADADVKREIARKQEQSMPSDHLADEALAADDEEEHEAPAKQQQGPAALCNVILKSGNRAGQACFSACVGDSDRCVRHQQKKAK